MPLQNLSLCITLMTASGILRVVATMVLAFPDFVAKRHGRALTTQRWYVAGHVTLLLLAAFLSIAGTLYGPVSIAVPVQTATQLLCNVVAMGIVLQMRAFDKAQRTGTYVVFCSVLSLVDVGPGTQNGQDVVRLLSHWHAAVWCVGVSVCMCAAAVYTIPLRRRRRRVVASNSDSSSRREIATTTTASSAWAYGILTVGVTMSNVGMATAGKTLGSLQGSAFFAAALYYVVAAGLGLLFSIVSSTACDQGIFTPLSSVTLILVNMITGIVVWEDWKVIHTWVAYMCACLLMSCGVYLLAEIDLIERYFRGKTAAMASGRVERMTNTGPSSANQVDAWHDCLEEFDGVHTNEELDEDAAIDASPLV